MTRNVEYPQNGLRFVERQGKRILQQLWSFKTSGHPEILTYEWRDVPLEKEETPVSARLVCQLPG